MWGERAAAVLAVLAATGRAQAGPSLWDRVADPAAARAESVLEAAERARTPREPTFGLDPVFSGLLALRAATMIELAGGTELPSFELWFFLGDALVASGAERDDAGRRILLDALKADPDSPLAARAWFSVAIASSRLADYGTARDAYTRALEFEWDRGRRAQIYLNRAEETMADGDLTLARQDYATALALAQESEIYALANWGLGVALARSNELPQAIERVTLAMRVRFPVPGRGSNAFAIDLPTVFYTPRYEILYYRALADIAAAEEATDDSVRARALERARLRFEQYLADARPAGDRWVENVERLQAWCRRRLDELPVDAASSRGGSD